MWSSPELDKSKCIHVVRELLSARLITKESVLMRQLRDEDYVAVMGSLRDLASKSIGKHLKENHAGCKWTPGLRACCFKIQASSAVLPGVHLQPA